MVEVFSRAEPERWARRGYPNRRIFTGFPSGRCTWDWVRLTSDELLGVRHIRNEPSWMEIAGTDRSPVTAAAWVAAHPEDATARAIQAIHERLLRGERLEPIIIVGAPEGDLVVIEGNKRTVAAVMGGVAIDELVLLRGLSPHMPRWHFYSD